MMELFWVLQLVVGFCVGWGAVSVAEAIWRPRQGTFDFIMMSAFLLIVGVTCCEILFG